MSNAYPVVTFDAAKSEWNRRERGLPFDKAKGFDFDTALTRLDESGSEDERRIQALGKISNRIVFMVYIPTADGFHVISLRDAKPTERDTWLIHHP